MKVATVIVLACFVAVVASARYEHHPAVDSLAEYAVQEAAQDTPAQENIRPKRSLLLLKKKLILGALGLKAAKAAAVGAIVLKSKPKFGY
ncbi:uncharacterized protein LOC106140106 isoform X2 [Amyelois transitella]|uniref:uncharacterized protein LOC106140106 isoform X2 n=1 Tax=Amyelois transitella TaxID=680683 RepID=UPI00067BEC04|nr:uncharacterized protein LOC106140106 isoform X2 [Amyelois transitella]